MWSLNVGLDVVAQPAVSLLHHHRQLKWFLHSFLQCWAGVFNFVQLSLNTSFTLWQDFNCIGSVLAVEPINLVNSRIAGSLVNLLHFRSMRQMLK